MSTEFVLSTLLLASECSVEEIRFIYIHCDTCRLVKGGTDEELLPCVLWHCLILLTRFSFALYVQYQCFRYVNPLSDVSTPYCTVLIHRQVSTEKKGRKYNEVVMIKW